MSKNQNNQVEENDSPITNAESNQDVKSQKKLRVAPIWIISLMLHAVVLSILAYWVIKQSVKKEDVIVTTEIMEAMEEPLEEVKEVAIVKEKKEVVIETDSNLPPQITTESVADHNETDNNIETPNPSAEGTSEGISDSPQVGSGLMGNIGGGGASGGSFGQRFGKGKKRLLMKGGGSKKTESAVDLGLMWLANHQEVDGRWDAAKYDGEAKEEFNIADSGAAMLAFLGAGYTDKVGKYKMNVKKGFEYLLSKQKGDGSFGDSNYTNGMCTMALAEAVGMGCGNPNWRKSLESAVDFILKQQNEYAGWDYRGPSKRTDMSLTGWCIMALKSALIAGVKENEIKRSFTIVGDLLNDTSYTKDNTSTTKGEAWYDKFAPNDTQSKRGAGDAMIPIAMLIRQYLGWNRTENWMVAAANGQVGHLPKARAQEVGPNAIMNQAFTVSIYRIYYAYLALFQQGGDIWKTWNESVTPEILKAQRLDGDFKGSWDSGNDHSVKPGGRPLSTAFLCLSLEIYYRYASVMKE